MLFEGKESTQASIYNSVIECLQSRKLKYHINKMHSDVLEFGLLLKNMTLHCHILAQITDMDILLNVFLPLRVTDERFSKVVTNMLQINNKLTMGCFYIDLQTGELSYRFHMTCWRVTPSPEEIAFMLDIVSMVIERYADALV